MSATAKQYAYLALAGEDKIALYDMDTETGKLHHREDCALEGSPGPLAMDPGQQFLYAGIRSTSSISSLKVDPDTGSLTPIGSTPIFDNPVYLMVDAKSRTIVTSSYGAGKAGSYPIGEDGVVQPDANTIVETRKNPHSIQIDPSNRFVFVPNTGSNCILQYVFDQDAGTFEANSVPVIDTAEDTGPRHFYFYPSKNWVYFVNEKGNSIDAFEMDETNGTLTHFQSINTLPDEYDEVSHTAHIEVTPSGKYLYASNRGHDSIAAYSIDSSNGRLTTIGQYPTEDHPRSFTVDPTETFLYSAGQNSGKLVSYRINQDSGALETLETNEVGESPAWVMIKTFG